MNYPKSSVLILGGLPALSFFDGDTSIGVTCKEVSDRFSDVVIVAGVEDDFRSTLTKLDDVTVTLGNNGIILAGLSFKDGEEEVIDVDEVVVADVDLSKLYGATDWRSRPTLPAPTRPNPGCLGGEAVTGFPSRILRSTFDLSNVVEDEGLDVGDL